MRKRSVGYRFMLGAFCLGVCVVAQASPANRVGLMKHYERFLARGLANCITCHLPQKPDLIPTSLANYPHNPFGKRLMVVASELAKGGKKSDITTRLQFIAKEDSDGDGVSNEDEILLGHNPGDPKDTPSAEELRTLPKRRAEFQKFL